MIYDLRKDQNFESQVAYSLELTLMTENWYT